MNMNIVLLLLSFTLSTCCVSGLSSVTPPSSLSSSSSSSSASASNDAASASNDALHPRNNMWSSFSTSNERLSPHARKWIHESLHYYNRLDSGSSVQKKMASQEFIDMAMRTYVDRMKLHDRCDLYVVEKNCILLFEQLESFLDQQIQDKNDHDCPFGRLAAPMLILSLLLQSQHRFEEAGLVFQNFFKLVRSVPGVDFSNIETVLKEFEFRTSESANQSIQWKHLVSGAAAVP